jgi:O-antigen/teichoic acid export membrane protein
MQMADRVVILLLFGKYELGLYAVIMRLAAIPQFLIGTVSSGFMPVMYGHYKTEEGKKLIRNFFNIYFILIPLLFIVTVGFAPMIVELFAGKEYTHIAYLFPMALMAILFTNGTRAGGMGFTIKRKTHYIMYITLFSVVLSFILSLLLGYWVGIAGVILGTLISGIIRTYIHIIYSEKLYNFGYNFKYLFFISLLVLMMSLYSFIGNT